MNLMHRHLLAFAVAIVLGAGSASFAQPKIADCEAFGKIDYNKTFDADPKDIDQCIQRGWDPPVNWRPGQGTQRVKSGGAGSTSISSRNPPPKSPGALNAPASISSSMFNFTMGIPPWRGFPCQLPGGIDVCGGSNGSGSGGTGSGSGSGSGGTGSGGGAASACPVAGDTTGTYGEQQPVTASASKTLTCGGAVPLSTYMMSAEASPSAILATEAGNRTVWVYRASGSGYALQGTLQLPATTCSNPSDPESAAPTPMPIAQILTIGSNTASVALRLQMTNPGDVADPFDTDPDAEPVNYFVVPTPGGNPQIPSGCPRTSDFIRTAVALTAPITVESATNPGCEGTPEACGSLPQNPTSPSSCDAVTTNPSGTSCEGTTLFAVLNRPNLLFPPASTAVFTSMEGRTAHLVGSVDTARLYVQSSTIMYFGARGGSFTLPEGGTLKLDNGTTLVMNGPAIVNAPAGQVTMTNGGSIQSSDATTLQQFGNGSIYSPQASLPFVVRVTRSVEIPASIKFPTQPSPYVRLPVKAE